MSSGPWWCYNKSCRDEVGNRTVLGTHVRGELVLDLRNPNIQCVNTDEAILVVTCARCGRANKWVPKDSALVKATLNIHAIRSLIQEFRKLSSIVTEDVTEPELEQE